MSLETQVKDLCVSSLFHYCYLANSIGGRNEKEKRDDGQNILEEEITFQNMDRFMYFI